MWDFLLHRALGIGNETSQIRFGAGVVHLTTAAFIAFCVAVGGVAWALSREGNLVLAVVAMMLAALIIFLIGTWLFANRNPDQAALGGSWWYKFRELQMDEAKGHPKLPTLPSTTDPRRPAPQLKQLDAPDEDA